MKSINFLNGLLALSAAAVLSGGCASPTEHSFNDDFGEALPTHPMYSILDEDDAHYKILVHQGSPSNGMERVINVKQAATSIAAAESKRRGWEKYTLNYIHEGNQGWMHQVIGEVTREKYVAPTFPQALPNP